jgi:hypothetical protein
MTRPLSALLLTIVLFSQLLVGQAQPAPQSQNSTSSTGASTHGAQQPKANCTHNGTYVNSKGQIVKRPETCSSAPQGATAQCRDGTYSFSRSRRGTCSHTEASRSGSDVWALLNQHMLRQLPELALNLGCAEILLSSRAQIASGKAPKFDANVLTIIWFRYTAT